MLPEGGLLGSDWKAQCSSYKNQPVTILNCWFPPVLGETCLGDAVHEDAGWEHPIFPIPLLPSPSLLSKGLAGNGWRWEQRSPTAPWCWIHTRRSIHHEYIKALRWIFAARAIPCHCHAGAGTWRRCSEFRSAGSNESDAEPKPGHTWG